MVVLLLVFLCLVYKVYLRLTGDLHYFPIIQGKYFLSKRLLVFKISQWGSADKNDKVRTVFLYNIFQGVVDETGLCKPYRGEGEVLFSVFNKALCEAKTPFKVGGSENPFSF